MEKGAPFEQPPQRETYREKENRRQNEIRAEFLNNLRTTFGPNPFTMDDLRKARIGGRSPVSIQDRMNSLTEEGQLRYFTKEGKRYYQIIE